MTTPLTSLFQSTRPVRDATGQNGRSTWRPRFQSTRPVRDATRWRHQPRRPRTHFNPRAPYGTRPKLWGTSPRSMRFQSTRPVRDATGLPDPLVGIEIISIHAPRTGRDWSGIPTQTWSHNFNPRAPYGTRPRCRPPARFSRNFNPRAPYGTRRAELRKTGDKKIFQSTRPVRDATKWPVSFSTGSKFQSTRPVRDATRPTDKAIAGALFQSTRPVRDATLALEVSRNTCQISIHAPRTGRDRKELDATKTVAISIHAPRTGRDTSITNINLTLPISIHAPRTGRD